eukprot:tig00021432_g21244.t1
MAFITPVPAIASSSFASPAAASRCLSKPQAAARNAAVVARSQFFGVKKTFAASPRQFAVAAPIVCKKQEEEKAALAPFSLNSGAAPIADYFTALNLPEPLVHWGHPFFMSVVLFAMGGVGVDAGWKIRNNRLRKGDKMNPKDVAKAIELHTSLLPVATFFFFLGSTGGLLSMVMQSQEIQKSGHYYTAILALAMLVVNAFIPLAFGGASRETARNAHAYLGVAAFVVLLVHFANGIALGLSF